MTGPELPDSGMASGSDAGEPGDHLGDGDLRPDEERLLGELTRGAGGAPEAGDAELRAAEDEAPLPADGGSQDDGLDAEFSDPA
ncbi:hypothetical protein SAMN05660690_2108 [Geodermatophilus telluris]|uniref:Uncharacterized protein n=1 Tax=Geodermatophilus telluris TaxID=1190417 RepID=A0A1G6MYJ3_9ACTN|nr:hypothetical protein [Geodermatophilus telluris]SDC60622.1 hypothetical protein SAMN05660690_2108 [Geodermatophilus telluris]